MASLGSQREPSKNISSFAPLLAGALIVLASVLLTRHQMHRGDWYWTHEHTRYPVLVEHFYRSFRDGFLWPRWLPDLAGGHGYPEFVFYQPLFFFIAAGFRALTKTPVFACFCAAAFTLTCGAWGSFRLAGRSGNVWLGGLGATGFLLMPYVAVDWLVRGDLSELLATALCPWALSEYLDHLDLDERGSRSLLRSIAGIAISLTLVLLAHPIIGTCLGIVFALPVPLLAIRLSLRPRLVALVIGGVGAVLLSSPYWLPLLLMKKLVALDSAFDAWKAPEHLVEPLQFLATKWGYGGSEPPGKTDEMSFRLGGLWLAFALVGVVTGVKKRETQVLAGLLLAVTLAMMPVARPLWFVRPFSMMQFPWRLLSVAVSLQLALLRSWEYLPAPPTKTIEARLSIALIVFLVGWHPEQFEVKSRIANSEIRTQVENAKSTWDTLDIGEFSPKTAATKPPQMRGKSPLFFTEDDAKVSSLGTSRRPEAEILAKHPVRITLRQFYLPGYVVKLDGIPVSSDKLRKGLDSFGRITFDVVPRLDGKAVRVTAGYEQPRGARVGFALAAGALCLWLGAWSILRRKARSPSPVESRDSAPCEVPLTSFEALDG